MLGASCSRTTTDEFGPPPTPEKCVEVHAGLPAGNEPQRCGAAEQSNAGLFGLTIVMSGSQLLRWLHAGSLEVDVAALLDGLELEDAGVAGAGRLVCVRRGSVGGSVRTASVWHGSQPSARTDSACWPRVVSSACRWCCPRARRCGESGSGAGSRGSGSCGRSRRQPPVPLPRLRHIAVDAPHSPTGGTALWHATFSSAELNVHQ